MPGYDYEQKRERYLANAHFYADDVCLHLDIAAMYTKFLTHTDAHDVDNTMALINKVENLRDRSDDFQFALLDACPGATLFNKDQALATLRMLKKAFDVEDENYEYANREDMDAYAKLRPLAEKAMEKIDAQFLASVEDYEALAKLIDIGSYKEDMQQVIDIKDGILPDDKGKYMMPDEYRIVSRDSKGNKDYLIYTALRAQKRCMDVFPKFDLDDGYIRALGEDTNMRHATIYTKPVFLSATPDKNRIDLIFVEEKSCGREQNYVTMALPLDTAVSMMEGGMRENMAKLSSLQEDPSLKGHFLKCKIAEIERQGWEQLRGIMENIGHVPLRDPRQNSGYNAATGGM